MRKVYLKTVSIHGSKNFYKDCEEKNNAGNDFACADTYFYII